MTENEHLRELADKLDAESAKPEGEWSAKKLLGAWVRASNAWWEATGEPLI